MDKLHVRHPKAWAPLNASGYDVSVLPSILGFYGKVPNSAVETCCHIELLAVSMHIIYAFLSYARSKERLRYPDFWKRFCVNNNVGQRRTL